VESTDSRRHRRFRTQQDIELRYKKGGGGDQTVKQNADPWSGVAPNLLDLYGRAYTQSFQQMPAYPGAQVAPFTPEQELAQKMTAARAVQGNPLLPAAQAQTMYTMGGGYLDPSSNPAQMENLKTMSGAYLTPDSNPALNFYAQRGLEQAVPTWNTGAINAGRYGSGDWSSGLAHTESDLMQSIYGGAYEGERNRMMQAGQMFDTSYGNERGRMMQAQALAPQLALADYEDMSRLAAVGAERQGMGQAGINAAMGNYNWNMMEPWKRLDLYSQLLGGSGGGSTTTTIPTTGGSSIMSGLGGGLTGLGLASQLGSTFYTPATAAAAGSLTPWGWGLGLVGLLAGLYA